MHLKVLLFSGFLFSFFSAFSQSTDPAPYCENTYHNQDATIDNHISLVSLNTLVVPTSDEEYTNNTGLFTNLDIGTEYTLSVTLAGSNTQGVGAWIDYNQNDVFEESERVMNIVNSAGLSGIQEVPLTIPISAYNGQTRIRVRTVVDTLYFMDNGETDMVPCESPYTTVLSSGGTTDNFANGETEDYTVIFSGACVNNEANVYSFDFSNKNYDIISERKTWEDAVECAKNRGGHLVQLEYESEYDAVHVEILGQGIEQDSTSASSASNLGFLWLGGTDKFSETTWRWDGNNDGYGEVFWEGGAITGSPIGGLFNNWVFGPSAFGIRDGLGISLAVTSIYGPEGSFVDLHLNEELYFIVEYPEVGTPINDYCVVQNGLTPENSNFHISNFKLENIDTSSTNAGYADFYDVVPEIDAGLAYTASISITNTGAQGIAAWIDYNQNSIFEETELIGQEVNSDGLPSMLYDFGFNVPLTADLGKTKMRIRVVRDVTKFTTNEEDFVSPCDDYFIGETEDYTIDIKDQNLGTVPLVIVTSTNNVLSIETDGQTVQMIAQTNPTVEPVTWSVTPLTGDAIIDADGLLSPIANGTVSVVATAIIDGAPVEGTLNIDISNQTDFVSLSPFGDTVLSLCNGQNGTYIVDVNLKNGFSNTMEFSLTGAPTGTNFTITPATLNGDGQVTVTMNNVNAAFLETDLVFNGSVVGTTISENMNLKLKTFNGNPFFTSPLLPLDDAVSVSLLPFFDWTESLRADWYELQISTTSDFSSIVHTENNIVESEISPVFNFLINQDYYWRVKPHNPCGSHNWTQTFKFTTQPYSGIQGCTDPSALNYNPGATIENGTCNYPNSGCTDVTALNYDEDAVNDNGSCNFNILMIDIEMQSDSVYKFSLLDDGSSGMVNGISWNFFDGTPLSYGSSRIYSFDSNGVFPVQMKAFYPAVNQVYTIDTTVEIQAYGCTDPFALNYNVNAVYDLGNCVAKVFGCTNPLSTNYNPNANVDDGSCSVVIMGCTDPTAYNYNSAATNDDGSCEAVVMGCIDSTALNYDPLANTDDGSCIPTIEGCMDSTAFNYNPNATVPDGSCEEVYTGCTNEDAINFVSYANTDDGSCLFTTPNDENWQITVTSENHSILIQSSIDVSEINPAIANGDYLGVFYTKNDGTEQCAGRIVWDGENTSLIAYGTEDGMDNGFAIDENFIWKLWRKADNSVEDISTEYDVAQTHQSAYANDGISSVLKFGTGITQSIPLQTGWNFISTNLSPLNSAIDTVFSNVVTDLFLVKDELGNVYWPSVNINNIGNHIIGEAYKVNMNADTTLEVKGLSLSPENYNLTLNEGWSYIGYLRKESANVSTVMSSVASKIFIMKNIDGDVYWPQFGINNLGNMEVGKGYQINMITDTVFSFPSNDIVLPVLKTQPTLKPVSYTEIEKSTRHMHLAIPVDAWNVKPTIGSEIGAFIEDKLVGSSVFNEGSVVISIYGDELKTLDNKTITFRVLENEVESKYEVITLTQKTIKFQENEVMIAKRFKRTNTLNIITEFVNSTNFQINVIEGLNKPKEIRLLVSDYLGRLVFSNTIEITESQTEIELPILKKGNYIINISENGKTIETLKWLR